MMVCMFFIIYLTTNKINGKRYIGMHKTENLDDGYIGSGKMLLHAVRKYGKENFHREILFFCDTYEDMVEKEKELVTREWCLREDTYNLGPGGRGGLIWLVNPMSGKKQTEKQRAAAKATRADMRRRIKKGGDLHEKWKLSLKGKPATRGTTGFKYTEEMRQKMSKSGTGERNSQYGTMWITNGEESRKIRKDETIPDGWVKGRRNNTAPVA